MVIQDRALELFRAISRVILREKDRDRLLQGACQAFVDAGKYRYAWVGSFREGEPSGPFYRAGATSSLEILEEQIDEGRIPPCIRRAVDSRSPILLTDPASECPGCPVKGQNAPGCGVVVPLHHREELFGWVSLEPATDGELRMEEGEVIREVGDQLGYALWILAAEDRRQTDEARYARIIQATSDAVMVNDLHGRITLFNPGAEKLLGYSTEEVEGLHISSLCPEDLLEDQATAFASLIETGSLRGFDTERISKTGERVPVEITANVHVDGDGKPAGTVAVLRDIRERKGAQAALRESENRFREMAELLPEAVFETDLTLKLTYANKKAFDLFGYSREDFDAGISALDTLPPEGQKEAQRSFSARMDGEDPGVKEYTAVRKDGSTFPILFHASLIVRNGAPVGLRGIIVDLSEREKAREALRETERRFRNVVESSPMGMHFYDLQEDGSLVFTGANPAADVILGYENAQFVGKTLEDAFPGLIGTEVPQRYREAAAAGKVWRYEHLAYEEGQVTGAFNIVAFQTSPGRMAVLFVDVTEQRTAQERLKRSEERLRLATRSGRVGVWEYDPNTDQLEWDDLMYEMYGVSPDEAVNGQMRWIQRVHPEDLERLTKETMAAMESDETPFDTEFRIIRARDGEERTIRAVAGMIRDPQGGILRSIGTNSDVTEPKRAREALEASERKFRSVIEQSNDAIYIIYQDRFELVNRRFCELTEVTPEDVASPGFNFWELVAEESRPLIKERQESRMKGEAVPDLYEFSIRTKSGRVIQVEASVSQIAYRGEIGVLGTLRDITEQKSLQSQLHQAQKMESIGRLSGGVAHDLNNLLTPIIGYAELLRDEMGPEDGRRESAEEIVQAGFRARDLVRQLLAFSRQQTLEFKPLDLNQLLQDFEKLLRRTIREDIQIQFTPTPGLPRIRADKGQLEQVIMNLAVNAQDAMAEGGVLHIETGAVEFDQAFAKSRAGVTPGDYVMLALTDTGIGMDEETQARIFEPFFTTKGTGEGTGLGLATVYGIVKQHGGNIWVYSEPGSGTTFRCYFPLSDLSLEDPAETHGREFPAGGSETIMVVEDEEAVRNLAVGILERNGYSVVSAADAESCIELMEGGLTGVDLLLTDVVLPGMNGRELYQEVARIHPESRVLFMSGYSDDVVTHRGVLEEGIHFLQKPFSVHSLARKVREVLDGS